MCDCEKLEKLYEGLRIEDIPELTAKVKEIHTDFKKWETVYICPDCGQKWLEKYTSKGHGDVPEVSKL